MSSYRLCFVIPCYNHGSTIAALIRSLKAFELPIVVIDDGSDLATKQILENLAKQNDIALLTLAENQGKGSAVIMGVRYAKQAGFTHVLQIDADGQHDTNALPVLIEKSIKNPEHLISGQPIYDETVPKSRLYGRYITHFWVWVETLSFAIKDSMCGLRIYPISKTLETINKYKIGTRMDFDTDLLVRLYWEEINVEFVKIKVIYPKDGISHFDLVKDNLKISWLHTRLFFAMLPRIPKLIARHFNKESPHWSSYAERGSLFGIKLLLSVYRLFGRKIFTLFLKAVIHYYQLTAAQARQASEIYLGQIQSFAKQQGVILSKPLDTYHHMLSFGQAILDKLAAWNGDIGVDNLCVHGLEHYQKLIDTKQGILILGSHLGNLELCRALSHHFEIKINALVFTEHAQRFDRVMKAVNPESGLNLIQVSSIGVDTVFLLQQKLEQGEWVVIVADRTSVSKEIRCVYADFLGMPAPFPQGPFILASVLQAPVYLLFGLRDEKSKTLHFDIYFEPFCEKFDLAKSSRQEKLKTIVQSYANRLQHFTLQAPLQWYNFFNFWTLSEKSHDQKKP